MTQDYYNILGVSKDATGEQIKKAYRKQAMQYHPDRNLGKEEWANQKFKEINEKVIKHSVRLGFGYRSVRYRED